ncbi:hypothetical protein ACFL5T_02765 [Gemmatimonadota bacterium]
MTAFRLRFDPAAVPEIASRYSYQYESDEREIEESIAPAVREQGYFSKDQLLTVCRWKSPRTKSRVIRNTDDYVQEVTRTALSTPNERMRIEVLTLLTGVGWPTASVLLHFGHSDRYPILDYRALWSVSSEPPNVFDFSFWRDYTEFCRETADGCGVSMRTLDRALWQYSKEDQPS